MMTVNEEMTLLANELSWRTRPHNWALAIFSCGRQATLHVETAKSGPGYGATVGIAPTIRKWSTNNYIVASHVLSTFLCNKYLPISNK